ncbi:hypothetical protein BDP55DRAFT_22317 [Colletotrichum godetiae]|uniref:Uncharacterized protein n=1 Tax=Colletotrichum godetiae TaxID=1209918 RepID=A0AAJ0B2X9_9PEZI|nr:uncharacterized protein BDP55DRAFT_22317 [Colletotrichum godetiae]KAK1701485.1 hypothetical protein BDP55DRAFT_22317 [Colletotrichum godetiae]
MRRLSTLFARGISLFVDHSRVVSFPWMEWNGVCDAVFDWPLSASNFSVHFFSLSSHVFSHAIGGIKRGFPTFGLISSSSTPHFSWFDFFSSLVFFFSDSERRRRAYLLVRICLFPAGILGKCGWHSRMMRTLFADDVLFFFFFGLFIFFGG